ncbi:alanine racemase [Enterobacter asburiae]|uniref:Alanine racemase, biosynthetic n=1 Tax=Enterobacter asburiae TaxID=61645 RepID=A0A376FKI3_ENTAS|nr:alanine racemase [Enterobacter asburiae]
MQAATVVINRRALRHNLQRLRELAPASKLVAVVKANAYGHGLLETARTLPDADAFGVARLEEALRLRAGGITQPILLLEGFFEASDLPTIADQHLHTAVHNEEQLTALETAELSEPVTVWMKLDTGMHRLGVRPESAEAFYQRLCRCKNVRQPVNIVSHFARADEPECGATERQLDIFNTFCEGKPGDALDCGIRRYSAVAAVAFRLGATRHYSLRRVAAGEQTLGAGLWLPAGHVAGL